MTASGPPPDAASLARDLAGSWGSRATDAAESGRKMALAQRWLVGGAFAAFAAMYALQAAGVEGSIRLADGVLVPYAMLPFAAVFVAALVVIPVVIFRSSRASDDYFEALGLRSNLVRPGDYYKSVVKSGFARRKVREDVDALELTGSRRGRMVAIRMHGESYRTLVGADIGELELRGHDGRLYADTAPPAVREWLLELPADRRWDGAHVRGADGAVAVSRTVTRDRHAEALWLVDLWLAERLDAIVNGPAPGAPPPPPR